ncbi:unnamed protein product [Linum tenue]|uniref:Polyphenol oxidase central domain-containing protein n=1 Tax=Linum tenue TaxID=586396 RepID=A0AAV0IRW7_9ROSI|nr:unnamed protein product [Linum tenue]
MIYAGGADPTQFGADVHGRLPRHGERSDLLCPPLQRRPPVGLWSATHKGFDDPAFLNSYTYFYDETLRLVRIRFSDVVEMDKLRYRCEVIENA